MIFQTATTILRAVIFQPNVICLRFFAARDTRSYVCAAYVNNQNFHSIEFHFDLRVRKLSGV